jgi:hypothetical protein
MAQPEMHLLFQQMGEVLTGIRALHDTMAIRQAQTEQLHDLLRADLTTLRQDQRELEEKFDCVVSIVQHETEALRSGAADNARSIRTMVNSLDALRKPIDEILGYKSRVAGVLFAAGILGSAALWLAEPAYSWLVNASFAKH